MADWAAWKPARGSLIVQRLDPEGAVRELRELLHACLRLRQRGRGVAQTGHSLLEEGESRGELEGFPLELCDDVLQARQPLLDRRHRSCSGSGRVALVTASTSPSRSRSVNGLPG